MAKFHLVEKKVRMSKFDIIKYQIFTFCFINHIDITPSDIECLTNLGESGEIELTDFCKKVAKKKLEIKMIEWENSLDKKPSNIPEPSPQSIRNSVIKLEKINLIVRLDGKRKICINPLMKIQSVGNILLDFKIVHVDS